MKKLILFSIIYCSFMFSGCNNSNAAPVGILEKTSEETIDETESEIAEESVDSILEEQESESEAVESRENTDFRMVYWGENSDSIKKYEGEEYTSSEDGKTIVYNSVVGGYDAQLAYMFDSSDNLFQAAYLFKENYSNGAFYISQYDVLKSALLEKYGDASEDEITPLKSQSLIDSVEEGEALERGYVVYYTIWETASTNITLMMMRQDHKISIDLVYKDITFESKSNTDGL